MNWINDDVFFYFGFFFYVSPRFQVKGELGFLTLELVVNRNNL